MGNVTKVIWRVFAWMLICSSASGLIAGFVTLFEEAEPLGWPSHDAIVIQAPVITGPDSRGRWTFHIKYRYQIEGVAYESTCYTYTVAKKIHPLRNHILQTRREAEALCASYPINTAVKCRVDPRNNRASYIVPPNPSPARETAFEMFYSAALGLFIGLALLQLLFLTFRPRYSQMTVEEISGNDPKSLRMRKWLGRAFWCLAATLFVASFLFNRLTDGIAMEGWVLVGIALVSCIAAILANRPVPARRIPVHLVFMNEKDAVQPPDSFTAVREDFHAITPDHAITTSRISAFLKEIGRAFIGLLFALLQAAWAGIIGGVICIFLFLIVKIIDNALKLARWRQPHIVAKLKKSGGTIPVGYDLKWDIFESGRFSRMEISLVALAPLRDFNASPALAIILGGFSVIRALFRGQIMYTGRCLARLMDMQQAHVIMDPWKIHSGSLPLLFTQEMAELARISCQDGQPLHWYIHVCGVREGGTKAHYYFPLPIQFAVNEASPILSTLLGA